MVLSLNQLSVTTKDICTFTNMTPYHLHIHALQTSIYFLASLWNVQQRQSYWL